MTKNLDAVVIATCNHWHALAAIWACQAGKDVYVEKPLSHNHWEGQQVVRRRAIRSHRPARHAAAKRSFAGRTEGFSARQARRSAKSSTCRFAGSASASRSASETPLSLPKTVDYDLWLGPAQDEPIYRDKLHYDWHWDWNTGNGELGNWGVHVLDDALNVVLRDRVPFPKRIAAAGGRVVWNDAGQTPNVCFVYYDTGSIPVIFGLSNLTDKRERPACEFNGVGSGYVVHCEGGYYAGGRGGGTAHDHDGKIIRNIPGRFRRGTCPEFRRRRLAATAVGYMLKSKSVTNRRPGAIWPTSHFALANRILVIRHRLWVNRRSHGVKSSSSSSVTYRITR